MRSEGGSMRINRSFKPTDPLRQSRSGGHSHRIRAMVVTRVLRMPAAHDWPPIHPRGYTGDATQSSRHIGGLITVALIAIRAWL
jgi:hypothetical protein